MPGRKEHRILYRGLFRRAQISIAVIVGILLFGTVVLHYVENYSYIDAFYFMSMLATAQGPTIAPATTLGKLFVSAMAFVSVGTVVTTLVFLFGPFMVRLLRIEERRMKKEEHEIAREVRKLEKEI